jgi:hypothetical protein
VKLVKECIFLKYSGMGENYNLSILHPKEEKDIIKIFHIKIQVNKIKVDALFLVHRTTS